MYVALRSTVHPGTCDRGSQRNTFAMKERSTSIPKTEEWTMVQPELSHLQNQEVSGVRGRPSRPIQLPHEHIAHNPQKPTCVRHTVTGVRHDARRVSRSASSTSNNQTGSNISPNVFVVWSATQRCGSTRRGKVSAEFLASSRVETYASAQNQGLRSLLPSPGSQTLRIRVGGCDRYP